MAMDGFEEEITGFGDENVSKVDTRFWLFG